MEKAPADREEEVIKQTGTRRSDAILKNEQALINVEGEQHPHGADGPRGSAGRETAQAGGQAVRRAAAEHVAAPEGPLGRWPNVEGVCCWRRRWGKPCLAMRPGTSVKAGGPPPSRVRGHVALACGDTWHSSGPPGCCFTVCFSFLSRRVLRFTLSFIIF